MEYIYNIEKHIEIQKLNGTKLHSDIETIGIKAFKGIKINNSNGDFIIMFDIVLSNDDKELLDKIIYKHDAQELPPIGICCDNCANFQAIN